MLHPADPSELIPEEQLTVAVVDVTLILLPAPTVGFVVHETAGVYVIVYFAPFIRIFLTNVVHVTLKPVAVDKLDENVAVWYVVLAAELALTGIIS